MMTYIKIKLNPFNVPNFVITQGLPGTRQEGFQESPKYALKELSEETLAELCDEFRKNVFEKAGKKDPNG